MSLSLKIWKKQRTNYYHVYIRNMRKSYILGFLFNNYEAICFQKILILCVGSRNFVFKKMFHPSIMRI